MINKGIVTAVEGDMLTIAFERHEACGDCHACMHGRTDCKHLVRLPGKANIGDRVEVEMDDSHVIAASAVAYMVPLVGFLLGLAGGWALSRVMTSVNEELVMTLIAVAGTAAAYLVMRKFDSRLSKGRWEQRIISVTPPEEDEE